MMDFAAFDVETANADPASICQVGVAIFEGGAFAESWSILVDPEAGFDRSNRAVHGIGPMDVAGAPRFPEVYDRLSDCFAGRVVAHHTAFDRVAVAGATARYRLAAPDWRWLDTARVARRAWPDCARRGYGLASLAARFAIRFRHHDAAEDARAAGLVLVRAIEESGIALDDWITPHPTARRPRLAAGRPRP